MQFRLYGIVIFLLLGFWSRGQEDTVVVPGPVDSVVVEQEEDAEPDSTGFWKLKQDSSPISPLSGLQGQLDPYRKDAAFQYSQESAEGLSAWDRFWRWFWAKWYDLMSREGSRRVLTILMWVLAIGALLYVMLRLIGAEKVALWMGRDGRRGIKAETVEDIHAIPYADAIRTAETEGRYREAVRYHFLQSLKKMADRDIIQWHRHKTNVDYAASLSGHPLSLSFEQIRRIYEYAWYGEFEVNASMYATIQPLFLHFDQQLHA